MVSIQSTTKIRKTDDGGHGVGRESNPNAATGVWTEFPGACELDELEPLALQPSRPRTLQGCPENHRDHRIEAMEKQVHLAIEMIGGTATLAETTTEALDATRMTATATDVTEESPRGSTMMNATATVTDDGGRRTLGETGHATVTDTATMIGEVIIGEGMAGDVSGKTNDGETVMIETEILEEQVPRAVRPLLVHAPSSRKGHPRGRAHVLRLLKTRRSRISRRPDCSRQLRRRSSLATAQRQS